MKTNRGSNIRFLRVLRTIHSWLGIVVMPWVVIIGLTGFYINHARLILPLFHQTRFSERGFEDRRPPAPITRETARRLGESLWPDQPIKKIWKRKYHGRPSYLMRKKRGLIVLSIPTGHYYLKTRYTRRTFSPEGKQLHVKFYWRRILKDLHRAGWLGRGLGTWPADVVSIAMVIFGLTGSVLWTAPKVRRFMRRSGNR